jgi:hypothetical protein
MKYFEVIIGQMRFPLEPVRLGVYRDGAPGLKLIFRIHLKDALSGAIKTLLGIYYSVAAATEAEAGVCRAIQWAIASST